MDHSLLLVVLITAACAVPVGLLLRSAAETKLGSPEPRLFVLDGALGLAATVVEKAAVGLTLFFGPSLTLLWLLHQMPESTFERRVWWTVNLAGIGVGKIIRWLRWRRTQDFL